jgi:hypothetical protein
MGLEIINYIKVICAYWLGLAIGFYWAKSKFNRNK